MSGVKILVAMHKSYPFPMDRVYVPVQVGAAGKKSFGIQRDDEGDNISEKNPGFCELTGLYYGWKNLSCDAMGLVHYRRYLAGEGRLFFARKPLSGREASALLKKYDILVPKKRNYVIESLYSHYAHTLDVRQLDLARQIITESDPKMLPYVDLVYNRSWGYMFNMYLMKKELSDEYCSWLFPILFTLEERMTKAHLTDGMNDFEARLYGRVSEILFNVWLLYKLHTENVTLRELPLYSTEKTNWCKKGAAFLAARFFGKKYKKSF